MNALHGLLNCEIGGLDCHVITTEYRPLVDCIHMYHLFFNALNYVIYLTVSGQCSYTIIAPSNLRDNKDSNIHSEQYYVRETDELLLGGIYPINFLEYPNIF